MGVQSKQQAHRTDFLVLGIGSVCILCLVLLPLLVISVFNHSYADDWHYGVWAHLALQQSQGNVLAAVAEALRQVSVAWFDWQGTYSAIFLMALQPGVFSESAYVISAWIVLALLVSCTLYFVRTTMRICLHDYSYAWLSVASALLVAQLLLQPSPVEGIFWYNSAIYYTGYHALMLLLMGFIIRTMTIEKLWVFIVRVCVATLLALFVAGGNFVTLLVALELGVSATIAVIVKRHGKMACVVIPTIALILGAIVSFSAPGNEVRQQVQFPNTKLGVLDTIVQSTGASLHGLMDWVDGFVVIMLLFLLPLFVYVLRQSGIAQKFSFSQPGWVSIASMALFASSFTPTLYSMGTVGPGRVQNCRFDLLIMLLVVNLVWWIGWVLHKRLIEAAVLQDTPVDIAVQAQPLFSARKVAHICAGIGLVFTVILSASYAHAASREKLSSLSAFHSIATGQAQSYDRQVSNRIYLIETSHEQEVTVPFYRNVPHVLLMGDIRDNMDNYVNYRLAQWYGKKSIIGYSLQPKR